MTVTPGLLDRRLRLYEKTEAGADGFTRPLWVFTVERWGRLDVKENTMQIIGTQTHREQAISARVTFAAGVCVPPEAIIRDPQDSSGAVWLVTGVIPSRQTRMVTVTATLIPSDSTAYPTMEAVEVLDGVHTVEVSA